MHVTTSRSSSQGCTLPQVSLSNYAKVVAGTTGLEREVNIYCLKETPKIKNKNKNKIKKKRGGKENKKKNTRTFLLTTKLDNGPENTWRTSDNVWYVIKILLLSKERLLNLCPVKGCQVASQRKLSQHIKVYHPQFPESPKQVAN